LYIGGSNLISVELTLRKTWNFATGSLSSRFLETSLPHGEMTGIAPDGMAAPAEFPSLRDMTAIVDDELLPAVMSSELLTSPRIGSYLPVRQES
jgi:hypothetical protein